MFENFDKNNIYSIAAKKMRNLNVSDKPNHDHDKADEKNLDNPDAIPEKVSTKEAELTNINHILATAERMRSLDPSPIPVINFKKIFKKFKK